VDHHHTVFILIHTEPAAAVALRALFRLSDPVYPPPAADDPLDVIGRAGPPDLEQPLFGLRSSDAGQRPDLGVRELAPGQRVSESRKRAERPRDADLLTRGAAIESNSPRQPVGTRLETVAPAAAGVELANQIQETGARGVEVR